MHFLTILKKGSESFQTRYSPREGGESPFFDFVLKFEYVTNLDAPRPLYRRKMFINGVVASTPHVYFNYVTST